MKCDIVVPHPFVARNEQEDLLLCVSTCVRRSIDSPIQSTNSLVSLSSSELVILEKGESTFPVHCDDRQSVASSVPRRESSIALPIDRIEQVLLILQPFFLQVSVLSRATVSDEFSSIMIDDRSRPLTSLPPCLRSIHTGKAVKRRI